MRRGANSKVVSKIVLKVQKVIRTRLRPGNISKLSSMPSVGIARLQVPAKRPPRQSTNMNFKSLDAA